MTVPEYRPVIRWPRNETHTPEFSKQLLKTADEIIAEEREARAAVAAAFEHSQRRVRELERMVECLGRSVS